jgi:hypothetical protein
MPIPLRQNTPMHRGYGPRMMPLQMPQRYHGGMPYNNFNYQPQQMARPMMSRNNGTRGGGGGGGGLLSKILGRGKEQGGIAGAMSSMNRAAPSGAGGILKSLTNPDALSGFLNNTQTVLKTAQQLGPVIQQYGPLVRNLPSLWKLYRGLKDASSDDSISENEESASTEFDSIEDDELVEINPILEDSRVTNKAKKSKPVSLSNDESVLSKNRSSIPKLYI